MKRIPSPERSPEPPMPTDPELLPDLPKLRLHIAADSPPAPEESTASSASPTLDGFSSENNAAANPDEEEEEEDIYRTPTSEESRIPMSGICPPAPVKRRFTLLRKRKLSELEFFETRNRAEVEEFFRQAEESMKRSHICKRIIA